MSVGKYLEHTLLKPEALPEQILKLCREAKEHELCGVCVNPCHVAAAVEELRGSGVKVVTVVGFPLGADKSEVKALAAKTAVLEGADEVDMVINIGALKAADFALVTEDIRSVVQAAGNHVVKVIIETCLLTNVEKVKACELIASAGAAFVKTSTGFSTGGATEEDVRLLAKEAAKYGLGVKASGGIRDLAYTKRLIAAGANRIGTSGGAGIVHEEAGQA